ncbi:16S rRNA (uracil(1498)-N(3))-methyltransferase [Marinibaculum pumilum]|uniref:Ribosomal RNA small subunit methyltransferase E n=1 Tax=Marinibaculum pumilum TaxID=1766165 RepID=A0ABV7KVY3_9PROT
MSEVRHRIRTRLFVAEPLHSGAEVMLLGNDANHVLRVLRMTVGDSLRLFNGRHGEWSAQITVNAKRSATLQVAEQLRTQTVARGPVLAFAPIRRQRMDWLLEKATELGAAHLVPVITAHTQMKDLRVDRALAVTREAAQQCERLDLPEISMVTSLAAFLEGWPAGQPLLFCDEMGADRPAPALLSAMPDGAVPAVLVGPEGGFDAEERAAVRAHPAACALDLGANILRAETAGIAALALLAAWRGGAG